MNRQFNDSQIPRLLLINSRQILHIIRSDYNWSHDSPLFKF